MEVIRFKSAGDMSADLHCHFSPGAQSEVADEARGAPGKWASCKLLGFRAERPEEVARHRRRFQSTDDFSGRLERESCPLEEMLAAMRAREKPSEKDEPGRSASRATAKWRASGARRRKVAAKLARLALSSPALAAAAAAAASGHLQQVRVVRQQDAGGEQQRASENNGQPVAASQATRPSQPMETCHLEQPANDSQPQVTGDAQDNGADKRQQQQQQRRASDNGNDSGFDRDGDSVGFASAEAALPPQSLAPVGIGGLVVGKAQIGENANACAPSPAATTTLEVSPLAKQQQQQSSAAEAGEAQAQSKQQVPHAHLSPSRRQQQQQQQHHKSHGSRRQEREQRKVDGGGGEAGGMEERILAAAAVAGSDRIAVEMVGQHWLRGAPANAGKEADTGNTSAGKLAELNLGAAANKLVGSLYSMAGHNWLQPPSHSGTYKVAQREQRQQAASAVSGGQVEIGGNGKQENESGGGQQQRQQQAITGRRVRRQPRPGRSPISLQRQTNARLAKHRAKIQLQRQEQLALFALGERQQQQQLGGHQFLGGQEQEGGMLISENQHQSDIYIINDRLPTVRASSLRRHRHDQQYRYSPSTSAQAFEDDQQQPQVISPATSTAIEICDNQLACTSSGSRGHNSSRGFNLVRPSASAARTNAGNVIVYKSINMFRNSPMVHESTRGVENDQEDAQTISSSGSTLSLSRPFCKICHMGSSRAGDKLISPCKCSGTMQYIHCGCLLKWLEISNRTNEKPMSCELCAHEYSWHKMFNYKNLRWPRCSLKDIFLHIVFVLALGVMIYSAIAPILQRKSQDNIASSSTVPASKLSPSATNGRERQQLVGSQFYHASLGGRSNHLASSSLASDEKLMLLCAASFFISFFLAIYVQTKARDTLYGLFVKFLNLNQTYYITEYDHGNSTAGKQLLQQQQQQHAASCPRSYRKSGQEELINS